ncbi:MAG: hypothetical protein M5U26_00020 [Planctomycetota bacterium]|nr:hypothetical protein [Planctomycetota bacterium]
MDLPLHGVSADELSLALMIEDLRACGVAQDAEWLLKQQGIPPDERLVEQALEALGGRMKLWLARRLQRQLVREESERLLSVIANGLQRGHLDREAGGVERYRATPGGRAFAAGILERWEAVQRPNPEADAPALLRYLRLQGQDTCPLPALRMTFFAPWTISPMDGAGLRSLKFRYETLRQKRLTAVLEHTARAGWTGLDDGFIRLTPGGRTYAASLPDEWR